MAKRNKSREVELDEDLELEDEDEDEEETPKAKKKGNSAKKKAPAKAKVEFGTSWLLEYVSEETDRKMTGRNLRVLLRSMAKKGELNRTVGEDRTNYSWTGPTDPEVKKIIRAIKDGAVDREKKAALEKLKASKQSKKAAAKKGSSKKARVVEDDDDEDEDDDDE